MSTKRIFYFVSLLILALIISGCSISLKSGSSGGNDGGVYVSANQGNTWQQKSLIPTTSGRPQSIGSLSGLSLKLDPSDNQAIYFGSLENGLFYSYDNAKGWQAAKELGRISVNDVAVDTASKCIIYAATGNKLYKSTDCNRTWAQVYYDNDVKTSVNFIAIDHYSSSIVYIGTSRGEVIKSYDRGVSWQTVGRLEDDVEKIVISPHDSRILFAATDKKGIFRSVDAGANWTNLKENLEEFKNSLKFRDLVLGTADQNLVLLATDYGMLRSTDNGDNWSKIELITPEKNAIINSLAISPKDSKQIYYVTSTTFYRSIDGGENWSTKKLPTTRAGWKLLVNPEDTNMIYLGVRKLKN